jgi:pyruvate kinase
LDRRHLRYRSETGRPIGVLAAVQEAKLRVGLLSGGRVQFQAGQKLIFDLNPIPGDTIRVLLPSPEFINVA